MKYDDFIQIVNDNKQQLIESGMFKGKTIDEYIRRHRRARPVTIGHIAQYLKKNWESYVD